MSTYSNLSVTEKNCNVSIRRENEHGILVQLPVWFHNGEHFVEGVPGRRYTIDVRNINPLARVEFVVSVDGVDIGDGEDGSEEKRGLVVGAGQSWSFDGYRTSMKSVATFRFCLPDGSYSSLTGRPLNVGVIGIATYNEQPIFVLPSMPVSKPRDPWKLPIGDPWRENRPTLHDEGKEMYTLSSRRESNVPQSLGTQFGEERISEVGTTTFTRTTVYPYSRVVIRYETTEVLRNMGIPVGEVHVTPNPFPATPQKFVQPPPGR